MFSFNIVNKIFGMFTLEEETFASGKCRDTFHDMECEYTIIFKSIFDYDYSKGLVNNPLATKDI